VVLAQRVWDEPFVPRGEGLHLGKSPTKKDVEDAVVHGYEAGRDLGQRRMPPD
jgi:hypothetical protein